MVGLRLVLALGFSFFTLSLAIPQPVDSVSSQSFSWKNCDTSNGIVNVQDIQISPDSPQAGKNLTVTIRGQVTSTVQEGAYATVSVKAGLVTYPSQKVDICQEARNSNLSIQCPVAPGTYTVVDTVSIPNNVPKGSYNAQINGYTADKASMFCVQATFDVSA
ncbi:hypothetical protein H0H93_010113 [Arthromyces matolae]|nr:hypothetical protein H0H93_010113 [Arthromyces matolae]